MLKRSITISCILIIFISYFDSSAGKKTFCEERNYLVCISSAHLSASEHGD